MKKIVTIGGGTGQFTVLRGLRDMPVAVSAIVSMADNGGSSGVLRDNMGVLPPGDVRQCITALSEESDIIRKLFAYRFSDSELGFATQIQAQTYHGAGHSFGNLFLSALEKITGNFYDAVTEASRILRVKGSVIPVSLEDMHILVQLNSGAVLVGESNLDHNPAVRESGVARVSLTHHVSAYSAAINAIHDADYIVIGPGDLYGSIIPPLLVTGIREAIQSAHIPVIYIANTTNKKGLTEGFSVETYVENIEHYIGHNTVTHVIYNTENPSEALLSHYRHIEEMEDVLVHIKHTTEGRVYIPAQLLEKGKTYIRHDSALLAQEIMQITRTY